MDDIYKINKIAQFADKNVEKEYFNEYFRNSLKLLRINILLFGIVYFILSVYDIIFLNKHEMFSTILIIRMEIFIISLIIFIFLKNIKNIYFALFLILAFEFFVAISYFFILSKIGYINFLEKCLTIMVLLVVNFSMPNKWIFSIIVEIFFFLFFFSWAYDISEAVTLMTLVEVLWYFIIIIIFLAMWCYRIEVVSRGAYAKKCQLEVFMMTDKLTGISNRRKSDLILEEWHNLAKLHNTTFSIIMFDLDNFKLVNDTYGHVVGDEVLIQTCDIVKKSLRSKDHFSRWGGEEFVILLPSTNISKAYQIAEKIRIDIFESKFPRNQKITCSFGVVQYAKEDTLLNLMVRVDELLYVAKKQGKNVVIK